MPAPVATHKLQAPLTEGDLVRFWSKVNKTDGCWVWVGGKDDNGYGIFYIRKNVPVLAHRLSFKLHIEDPGQLHVLHSCDNTSCVNPGHLFKGAHQDNMRDRDAKGRRVPLRGSALGNAKLTESAVLRIRRLYATGNFTYTHFANRYGVRVEVISSIIHRTSWVHI